MWSLNLKRDGKCFWKHKGRECLDEEFGSGAGSIGGSNGGSNGGYSGYNGSNGGGSSDENNGTGNNNNGGGNSPDKDFYRDFQKMLTHTMDISIARSTINLYL